MSTNQHSSATAAQEFHGIREGLGLMIPVFSFSPVILVEMRQCILKSCVNESSCIQKGATIATIPSFNVSFKQTEVLQWWFPDYL